MEEKDLNKKESKKKSKYGILNLVIGISATLIGGMAGFGLSKCELKRNNDFKRAVMEDGSISLEGQAHYKIVRDYDVVVVNTILDENKIFISDKRPLSGELDVFTGKRIHMDYLETEIVDRSTLEDYLIAAGKLKEYYTAEDMEEMRDFVQENYASSEKQVVLEKTK